MNRERVLELLKKKYLTPIDHPRKHYMGVEIEMPIVNLSGGPADMKVAQAAAEVLRQKYGFKPDSYDTNGVCYTATRPDNGDNLSFDCSYNNMELSFGKESNLLLIQERFNEYVKTVNEELAKSNHIMTGMGVNPAYQVNSTNYIPNERYRMMGHYMHQDKVWTHIRKVWNDYADFPTFASASQVQLDITDTDLIKVLKAAMLLEPIKSVLLANSAMAGEPDLLLARDWFYEGSTHGINPHNIGMYDCTFDTPDDLVEYIASCSIFSTTRNGKFICFEPVPAVEFFARKSITGDTYEDGEWKKITFTPEESDLQWLRTYKFADLTYRGTIEFRSACCQPFKDAFCNAAFHVGLMEHSDEIIDILENDHVMYHHGFSALELRALMNNKNWPEFIDREGLKKLCLQILDICRKDLVEHNQGEEVLIECLYERAESLTSPARRVRNALDAGESLEPLIREFAAVE